MRFSELDEEDGLELDALSTSNGALQNAAALHEGDQRKPNDIREDNLDESGATEMVTGSALYTLDEERAVIRKLDRRLVLFVAFLYMLSFLDRSNIGNARIAGLIEDLKLSSSQYEWLLTSFYCAYIAFQWMTLLYQIVPAHIYMSLCVASWSVIACLQSFSNSFFSMLLLRFLLGVGEAAFSPGLPFLMSFFYKRDELALRTGFFIAAAPLATSFASSLAWLITKAGERLPIPAWRLLFIVEGFPAIIVAVIAWFQIPDSPGKAPYLTLREKKVALLRLKAEKGSTAKVDGQKRRLDWHEIGQTLKDPKCWITSMMFFSCNVAFASLPPFLPTIIHEMNHSALASQALSAPPYLVAFIVVLVTAYLSDRSQNRSYFVIFHALLGGSGYGFIAIAGVLKAGSGWRYLGVYPAASGFFSAITLIIAWTINNQTSDSKRGTGVVLLNLVGQLGPLLGTRLYPDSDAPYYVTGMATCSGFMLLVAALTFALRLLLVRENQILNRKDDRAPEDKGAGEEDILVGEDKGSRKSSFRNML
ncbi:hypothetical protein MMC25_003750 [Agyrium rufum]|nr:hypothetical protein [Agyrium rufum]